MNKPPTANPSDPKLRSLSFVTALWMALVIALAMAGYAVVQKMFEPQTTWRSLFIHHLWHVIVLGGVIYLACWMEFRRLLALPLNRIYLHLYAVGKGRLEPLKVNSNIREIRSIVEGVNLMIWRMGRASDPKALPDALEDLRVIRETIRELAAQKPDNFSELAGRLDDLEQNLSAIAPTEFKGDSTTTTDTQRLAHE